jgi:membrane-associated protein
METVREVLGTADSVWVYPLGMILVAVSALIPPVPSTSVFVALGALSVANNVPNGFLLVVSMLAGALLGDLVTYGLVRQRDVAHWRMLSGDRAQKALAASRNRLDHGAVSWVLTSRFVPLGRLTMNVACAVTPTPWGAFMLYSLGAGILWSTYSVGIGALSGLLPGLPTEYVVIVAIALSLVLGRTISAAVAWYSPAEA